MGIADNKMKMAAAGSLGIALVLALAGTISPTMWTVDLDASEVFPAGVCGKYDGTRGLWTLIEQQTDIATCSDAPAGTPAVVYAAAKSLEANDCDQSKDDPEDEQGPTYVSKDTDCNNARDAKCKNGKAWSIIGILANAAALGLLVAGAGPAIGPVVASAFASVSYLIIWSIQAALVNATADNQSSGCGYFSIAPDADAETIARNELQRENSGFGAAFGCLVTAWILTMFATVLSFLGSRAE